MPPSVPRHATNHYQPINGARYSPASFRPLKRARTPNNHDDRAGTRAPSSNMSDKESGVGEDRRRARLKELHARAERMLKGLFGSKEKRDDHRRSQQLANDTKQNHAQVVETHAIPSVKRNARNIDEDDYGGDEDEEEEEEEGEVSGVVSPLQNKTTNHLMNGYLPIPIAVPQLPKRAPDQAKSSDEAHRQLEEEKKAAEDAAKESSQTMFYTLENDKDAMQEQEKLDELDRQVEAEASGGRGMGGPAHGAPQQGTLSSTNLGASSLTLKHLIRRIDAKRDMVKASDQQLRYLMSEVRKNRSKWANEERVGQEELYEAAERVLMELKAKTEWAGPFLQKVNKRDAPDYYNVIKHPMDIGTMLKKLKGLAYQSKKEFVDDLDLIWSNCLKYNAAPDHVLRKKAEHMKKETAKYIPLIPDVVIKSRAEADAEVEAEERRLQTEFDDGEDSDEEPLRTARGRKAPGKSSKKGGTTARKARSGDEDSTPAPETRHQPLSAVANLKNEHFRDADSFGFSTPPGRTGTPIAGLNGFLGSAAPGSQTDFSEFEMLDVSINGAALQPEDLDQEDEDFKTWRQVTKKDRARLTATRHSLFKVDRLSIEDPALLRTKAGMRRWMRLQKTCRPAEAASKVTTSKSAAEVGDGTGDGATLAEEINDEDVSLLPDYYDVLAGIPSIDDRLVWKEDSDGHIIDLKEECLRIVPEGYFTAPQSALSAKIDANMRQMQETRKIVAKIAIVKQMQLQAQTYQNQFQKYEPEPFVETDIPPHVVSDDGPIMSPWVCRAALQRSVGKIFYLAGFEEFQPSALETMTDIVSDYMVRIVRDLMIYGEAPKVYTTIPDATKDAGPTKHPASVPIATSVVSSIPEKGVRKLKPRFTQEEAILHVLHESGHDLDNLESYVTDDIDRLSSKLETHHTRTRDYLAELLRPALDPATAGQDGVGVFSDGSEQFVGGDFAEDIGEDFFGFKELGLDKEFGIAGFSVPLHLLQSRMHSAYQPANATTTSATGPVMQQPAPYAPLTMETLEDQIGLVKAFFIEKLEKAGDQPLIEDDDLPPKQRFPRPRLPPTGKITSARKRPIREQQMMARKKRRLENMEREKEAAAANALANPGGDSGSVNSTIVTNTTATFTGSNKQDSDMFNGGSTVDANGDVADDDAAAESSPPIHRKTILRPSGKLKLEPSQSDSSTKTGDPTKRISKHNDEPAVNGAISDDRGAESGREDNEEGSTDKNGANGMLSPESVVIAAH